MDTQTSGTVGDLFSVKFTSATDGWIAGSGGLILRTHDGGEHWNSQAGNPATAGRSLQAVEFSDTLNGWTAGTTGMVLRTTNGGAEWMPLNTGHAFNIRSIAVLNPETAWLAGDCDTVLSTTDAGVSWSYHIFCHLSYYNWPLLMITHSGPDNLWVLADSLYRSTDGGRTWTGLFWHLPELYRFPEDMVFVDANNGWVASCGDGEGGIVTHTSDGGNTWTQQNNFVGHLITTVFFANADMGWFTLESDAIYRTFNGGRSWNPIPVPAASGMGTLCMGTTQFSDSLNGWIILGSGPWWGGDHAIQTTDGGQTWQEGYSGHSSLLLDVYFVDATHGWMVGRNGTIFRYQPTILAAPNVPAGPARAFTLSAYPNPFNPNTTLSFDVPVSSRVRISIYDITGRLVQTLADRVYPQGNYRVELDGSALPSGIYFARLQGPSFSKTQKLVLLK
jgi:photosystem II stability/assembly factor-like uncharacterized protein